MVQRPPNVVVLSSDEHVCERMAYWLTAAGHRPSIAGSGYAANTIFGLKQSIAGLTVALVGDGVPDNRRLALQAGADLIPPSPLRRVHVLDAVAHADPAGRLECAS